MAGKMPELSVKLDLQTAAFTKGFEKANKSFDKFGRQAEKTNKTLDKFQRGISKMGAAIGIAFAGFMSGKLIMSLAKTAEEMDKIAKSADKLGLTTEALIGLNHAAEQSGISVESLGASMQRATRGISEAAIGTGTAKDALNELGLSATSLNKLSPDKQLERIADGMKKVGNQGDKVRLSMKLFGREGVSMVNMLKNGSAGLKEYRSDAEALGITFDRKLAAGVERANDAVDRMNKAFGAMKTKITGAAAPAIELLGKYMTEIIIQFGKHGPEATKTFGEAVKAMGNAAIKVIGFVAKALNQLIGLFRIAIDGYKQLGNAAGIAGNYLGKKWNEAAVAVGDFFGMDTKEDAKDLLAYTDAMGKRLELINGIAKETDKTVQSINDFNDAVNSITVENGTYEASTAAVNNNIKAISTNADKAGKALKKAGAKGSKAMKTLKKDVEEVQDKFSDFAINTLGDGVTGAFRDMMDGANSWKDTITSVIKDVIAELFRVLVVQKAINAAMGVFGGGSTSGALSMFASGGIVNSPTMFTTPGGGRAMAGESGAEAVMPLKRDSQGNLGVSGGVGNVTVNVQNYAGADVEVKENEAGQIDVIISRVVDSINRSGVVGNAIQNRYGLRNA